MVKVMTRLFDDSLSFLIHKKPCYGKAFNTELAVEALGRTVLPGLSDKNWGHMKLTAQYPLKQGFADKFKNVVRSLELGGAVKADQLY